MLMAVLVVLALSLTVAMFATRNSMLGFPSGIFWAVMGGHAYNESTVTWDIYYFIFFASMGMLIFSIFAAYGLRDKDLNDMEEPFGEQKEKDHPMMKESPPVSSRSKAIRDRAAGRRGRSEKVDWDKFRE